MKYVFIMCVSGFIGAVTGVIGLPWFDDDGINIPGVITNLLGVITIVIISNVIWG